MHQAPDVAVLTQGSVGALRQADEQLDQRGGGGAGRAVDRKLLRRCLTGRTVVEGRARGYGRGRCGGLITDGPKYCPCRKKENKQ